MYKKGVISMDTSIRVEHTNSPKARPDENSLGFGKYFTDHMFIMDYTTGRGWHDARVVPYGPISLEPSAMVFHYGQEVFEGLKAYRTKDDRVLLFRPEKNMERLNASNDRLCIPQIDVDFCVKAIKKLVSVDRSWVPSAEGTSLYIRPFIIAADPFLGVRSSDHFMFIVILSPVGAYYPEGLDPVRIYVESKYVRAVRGGIGYAKTGGNYAASIKSQYEAKEQNYTQVLWLDGVDREYVEEVGTMNVFFKIDGKVVTPKLNGSILPGITRMSCIELLKSWGVPIEERKLSVKELFEAAAKGRLQEAFGTGTAAVISPIGELKWDEQVEIINKGEIGQLSQRLYDTLTGIQWGDIADTFGWTTEIE